MITLYKYRPFNEFLKPIIKSQKIFFPARAKLNDPEDLKVNLINDVDEDIYRNFLLQRARQELWPRQRLRYELKKCLTAQGLSKLAIKKIENTQRVMQNYLDTLGILSLTKAKDSPELWKEYADEGKGVCIVFHLPEKNEYLFEVKYEDQRPQLLLSKLMLSPDAESEMMKVLYTKTKAKFEHEAEWRYFLKNGNSEFPFIGAVESIILGKNMPTKHKETIQGWIADAPTPIRVIIYKFGGITRAVGKRREKPRFQGDAQREARHNRVLGEL
ncbi:DUF2971 domain-containing protein [bacterium]|nr:MAG: DUF2971 domain-containing protein [bacterium]